MKTKSFKQIFALLAMTAIMIIPYLVFAENTINTGGDANPMSMLEKVAGDSFAADTDQDSLPRILGLVISGALSLLGIIFIILMVLAGYNWMMASGNEQKIQEAKDTIKRAIIGLVIVLGAWAIWRFILENLIGRL